MDGPKEFDEDHHAMMNGPRIAQSLPKEMMEALVKLAKTPTQLSSRRSWFRYLFFDA